MLVNALKFSNHKFRKIGEPDMQNFLGRVRRCVDDYHMIDAGDSIAVGVSGGKDSLTLLAVLA